MNFNFLIDSYPNHVSVDGKEYEVNSDFRTILALMSLSKDDTFNETEKRINSLTIFYKELIPDDTEAALKEMYNFMGCYQESKKKQKSGEESFDFDVDSMDIYSAFYQIYHIDLNESNMHWFKFVALFSNINDGTPNLVNKMHIRTVELNDMSDEQKIKYMLLKREYQLGKSEDFAEHQNALARSFSIGGDVDGT